MRRLNSSALRSLTTVSALAAFAAPGFAQQFQWTPGTIPGTARWTEGAEASDVDNDGDLDLWFADGEGFATPGTQRVNKLIINQLEIAAGQFADESFVRIGSLQSHGRMPAAADVDADGWNDCLFANGFNSDPPFLYMNRGAGQPGFFDEEGGTRGFTTNYSSGSANFGDLDNDGDLDVIICDSGNSYLGGAGDRPHLFFNDGDGNFTENPAALGAAVKQAHMDVQFVDIDNDFDLDFFGPNRATNGGVNHYLMLNDGAGNFTDVSNLIPTTSGNVYEAEAGDLDGDSDADLFFVSLGTLSEGAVRNNFVENGSLGFTSGPTFGTGDDNEIALFDYDNDGDYDAVVGSLFQSGEKLARNNGGGSFSLVGGVFEGVSDSTLDIEIADIDNDGDYDVISAQGESNQAQWQNKVYINSGSADTLDPVVVREEGLASPSQDGPWVVRAQVRDQVSEDGEDYISAVVDWTVNTSIGGSGVSGQAAALEMGGGMFRFEMTDTAAGSGAELCYTLTFTDYAGNSTTTSEVCVALPGPACGFASYGLGLGGANVLGLAGSGTPQVGGTADLDTTGMVSSLAFLGMTLTETALPLFGGTVLIDPGTAVTTFPVAAVAGTANFSTPIPNDAALAGAQLFFQSFEVDGAQPAGLGMSNGVRMTICP